MPGCAVQTSPDRLGWLQDEKVGGNGEIFMVFIQRTAIPTESFPVLPCMHGPQRRPLRVCPAPRDTFTVVEKQGTAGNH